MLALASREIAGMGFDLDASNDGKGLVVPDADRIGAVTDAEEDAQPEFDADGVQPGPLSFRSDTDPEQAR